MKPTPVLEEAVKPVEISEPKPEEILVDKAPVVEEKPEEGLYAHVLVICRLFYC